MVLIDGENLVYGLRHLLGENEDRAQRSAVGGFNFREELLADNLPSEILWFGARLRLLDQSDEIKCKSSEAIRSQAIFMNQIQAQNIHFIEVGYLRARESDPCEQCRHQTWKLAEKGVDVGLAVRMITEANPETELAVVSVDTDLLPAFKASARLGAKLIHVGYEYSLIHTLIRISDKSRAITLPLAQKYKT
jgi:uncharacterized LabA/DUF88 family protein